MDLLLLLIVALVILSLAGGPSSARWSFSFSSWSCCCSSVPTAVEGAASRPGHLG